MHKAVSLLVFMLVAAIFLNYVDRGMIAVAAPLIRGEMNLSATAFGIAISAFFWTYAPIQVVVGALVDRFRVDRLLAGGVALWGLATAATALVSGFAPLVALRVLLGLGESVAFPASSKLLAEHVTARRRGIANAGLIAAAALGPGLGTLAGGWVMVHYGWRAMFGVFGLATLLWLIPWYFVARQIPRNQAAHSGPATDAVSFGSILRCRALWAQCAAYFCSTYIFYFLLAWLPSYLVKSRDFSLEAMAGIAAATFVTQGISAVFAGWWSDWLVARGAAEATVRKAVMVGGHIGIAICIAGVVLAESQAATIVWLVLTGFSLGFGGMGGYLIAQIFAGPRAVGRWVGVMNFLGNLSGAVGPIVTGLIVDATGSYMWAFVVVGLVTVAGAILWGAALPRIEPIDWSRRAPAPA